MTAVSEGSQLFSPSVSDFAVHRNPSWWRSNSFFRPKSMDTRMRLLYSVHHVHSKICVYLLSHEEIAVSP